MTHHRGLKGSFALVGEGVRKNASSEQADAGVCNPHLNRETSKCGLICGLLYFQHKKKPDFYYENGLLYWRRGRDSVTFRDPGAAAFGIAVAFRIPRASQAVGSLFSVK